MILAVSAFAFIAVLGALAFLRPASTAPIRDAQGHAVPESIAVLEKLRIGGATQSVLIRGRSIKNPVLLFLHGGPGTSELGVLRVHNLPALEAHFIVVVWDQRGAGKSYSALAPESNMTIEQFISDTHELSVLLCERFQQSKIYLAGHSWGSMLGALTVQRYPELYRAFIGIGQAVNMVEGERISYQWTLAQAEQARDAKSIARLKRIGEPPYRGELRPKLMTQRRILAKYGGEVYRNPRGGMTTLVSCMLKATEYSWMDRINVFRGVFAGMRCMWPQILAIDLIERVPELHVPVYFLEGRHDYEAPATLAERYFEVLRAPRKALVWFESSAHFVNSEQPEAFNRFFIERLLPETQR